MVIRTCKSKFALQYRCTWIYCMWFFFLVFWLSDTFLYSHSVFQCVFVVCRFCQTENPTKNIRYLERGWVEREKAEYFSELVNEKKKTCYWVRPQSTHSSMCENSIWPTTKSIRCSWAAKLSTCIIRLYLLWMLTFVLFGQRIENGY